MKISLFAGFGLLVAVSWASQSTAQIVGLEAESMTTLPNEMPFGISMDAGALNGTFIETFSNQTGSSPSDADAPRAAYPVTLSPGNFDLWVRIRADGDSGSNDSFFARGDGATHDLSTAFNPSSNAAGDWTEVNSIFDDTANGTDFFWINLTNRSPSSGEAAPEYFNSGELFVAGREDGTHIDAFAFAPNGSTPTDTDLDAAVAASVVTREAIAGTGFEAGETAPQGLNFNETVIEGGSMGDSGVTSSEANTGSNSYLFSNTGTTSLNSGAVELEFDPVDLSGFEQVQFSMFWTADGDFEPDQTERLNVDLILTDDMSNTTTLSVLAAEAAVAEELFNQMDADFFNAFGLAQVNIPDNIVSAQLLITGASSTDTEDIFIDDILFAGVQSAVIPEPASLAIWSLLGLGLAGFGYTRMRRKN